MNFENYLDFSNPRAIRIKGYRIGLEHLLTYYKRGVIAEDIAREFGLNLETIYVAITYYLTRKIEVDDYLKQVSGEAESAYQEWLKNPPPAAQRLMALRAQRQQENPIAHAISH